MATPSDELKAPAVLKQSHLRICKHTRGYIFLDCISSCIAPWSVHFQIAKGNFSFEPSLRAMRGALWGVIVQLETRFDRRVGSFRPLDKDAVECYVYKLPKPERFQGHTIPVPRHSMYRRGDVDGSDWW